MSNPALVSWYEASARQRLEALLDEGSFVEFAGPEERATSPHLALFDLPVQFDDGMIVGAARLDGRAVLVAAQEGRFMGGAIGEVHGAKLTGLLRAAAALGRDALILFDTGGVRLQEANAGEVAIAEIMRALIDARQAGCSILGLIGGRAGCHGGGGLIAACCTSIIISESGRLGVSGPEVIETNKGVEEFDSKDRALVWRTMGGKHRYLLGGADAFAADEAAAFRQAAIAALAERHPLDLATLAAEQERLARRLQRFGDFNEARDIWAAMGANDPAALPELDTPAFQALAKSLREPGDGAR